MKALIKILINTTLTNIVGVAFGDTTVNYLMLRLKALSRKVFQKSFR